MRKDWHILIVEDAPHDAEAIERELRQAGIAFTSRRVENREQFLEALGGFKPDVVLADFSLPHFDALAALRVKQEHHPDIPFILVTGSRSEEVAVECLREGADDYILKASLKRLPAAIENAVRKKAAERERARAEAALHHLEEQYRRITEQIQADETLRGLAQLIRAAQESERRRVARELHDSVNQLLSSVKFRLKTVEERLLDRDAVAWRDALKAQTLLEKAMQEVNRISRNLRPSELDDLGLIPALRSLGADFSERTGIPLKIKAPRRARKLPGEIELNVYRIVQEALNNIAKHSGARQAGLHLALEADRLRVIVRDNGCGFPPAAAGPRRTGMGLVDMRERAAFVGGTCAFESAPGAGTAITVHIPIPLHPQPVADHGTVEKGPAQTDQVAAGG